MAFHEAFQWIQPLILLLLLGVIIYLTLRQATEVRGAQALQAKPKIMVVEACGGEKTTRPWKEGEYVGMVTGECEKGAKRIVGIYVEEAQPQAQPGQRRKSLLVLA